jgi:hypothetical protein
MNYRRIAIVAAWLALALLVAGLATAQAQPQPGYGPGMMGGWRSSLPSITTLPPINSMDEARQAFQRYVDATGTPDLTVGEIIQFQWNYYAVIESTSTGQGAFELLADPQAGAVFPVCASNRAARHLCPPNRLSKLHGNGWTSTRRVALLKYRTRFLGITPSM